MNPKVKKGIDISLTVLVVVLFILGIFMVIIAFSSRNDTRTQLGNVFGYTPVNIVSDSMEPTIKTGSLVLIKEVVDYSTLQVDDIVTFRFINPDDSSLWSLNTHRIIEVITRPDGSYSFVSQGDKPGAPVDDLIYDYDIVGKVVGKPIPVLGSILDFLKSMLGFGLVIVLPLFVYFAYRVYVLVKVINDIRREKAPKPGADYEALLRQVEELKSKLGQKDNENPD